MTSEFARGARIRPKPPALPPKPPIKEVLSLPMFLLTIVGIAQEDYNIKELNTLQDHIARAWVAKAKVEAEFGPMMKDRSND